MTSETKTRLLQIVKPLGIDAMQAFSEMERNGLEERVWDRAAAMLEARTDRRVQWSDPNMEALENTALYLALLDTVGALHGAQDDTRQTADIEKPDADAAGRAHGFAHATRKFLLGDIPSHEVLDVVMQNILVSQATVAKIVGIDPAGLSRMARSGYGPKTYVTEGAPRARYRLSDVIAWIDEEQS